MCAQSTYSINQLLGQLLDLQEQWDDSPASFNWEELRALATAGAHCYNEGNGRSFQILATDGMEHDEFHLRFLEYSLEAGFDPFRLVRLGPGEILGPVFAHESLADAAARNPWSARMQARLRDVARARFGGYVHADPRGIGVELGLIVACCRDSIPADVIKQLGNALLAV
jgi:hypothetical protein